MQKFGLTTCCLLFSIAISAKGPDITECPATFHSIALHTEAQLCQIFDSPSPSSLIYFVKEAPDDAITFFLQEPNLSLSSSTHDRTLLMNATKSQRIVISPDGNGSQIDILVIAPKS